MKLISGNISTVMDTISREERSANMRAIRSKDMKPEMIVRSTVHRLGYRFRLHAKNLPGHPDLVLKRFKKVIFVHGCFWHQHGDPSCKIMRLPKSNKEYWVPKLERNAMRDQQSLRKLESQGWRVLTVWECETRKSDSLTTKIESFLFDS